MAWEPVAAGVGAVAVALAAWSSSRKLIRQRDEAERAEAAWRRLSDRRLETARALAAAARRYSVAPSVIEEMERAISASASANDLPARIGADGALSIALETLGGVAPDHPEFRANADVHELRSQLAAEANALAEAERAAHEARRAFNRRVTWFPTSLLARRWGWGVLPE